MAICHEFRPGLCRCHDYAACKWPYVGVFMAKGDGLMARFRISIHCSPRPPLNLSRRQTNSRCTKMSEARPLVNKRPGIVDSPAPESSPEKQRRRLLAGPCRFRDQEPAACGSPSKRPEIVRTRIFAEEAQHRPHASLVGEAKRCAHAGPCRTGLALSARGSSLERPNAVRTRVFV